MNMFQPDFLLFAIITKKVAQSGIGIFQEGKCITSIISMESLAELQDWRLTKRCNRKGAVRMGERRLGQRSKKYAERWKKQYERQRQLQRQIREEAWDILQSKNFNSTKTCIQHGNMTVHNHSMNVAKYSLAISEKLHIPCNKRALIRGALLHDYFLYDWHKKDYISPHNLHGFYHPGRALKNASREYPLTPREKEIIQKHMWPLTVVPPTCREAWIVTAADKWCSLLETAHVHRGHGALIQKPREYGEQERRKNQIPDKNSHPATVTIERQESERQNNTFI